MAHVFQKIMDGDKTDLDGGICRVTGLRYFLLIVDSSEKKPHVVKYTAAGGVSQELNTVSLRGYRRCV